MAEEMIEGAVDSQEENLSRVYEVGYHISPSTKEEDLEKVVSGVRSEIEKAGGSFIAEGAPALTKLSYAIEAQEGGKRMSFDRAYFGWIKFEAPVEATKMLDNALKINPSVLRFLTFKTLREDTRAKMKAPVLREVKRTDTIKATPRRVEEPSAPVSEEDLEKALQDLTAE
jgi:ribosomal protein S6